MKKGTYQRLQRAEVLELVAAQVQVRQVHQPLRQDLQTAWYPVVTQLQLDRESYFNLRPSVGSELSDFNQTEQPSCFSLLRNNYLFGLNRGLFPMWTSRVCICETLTVAVLRVWTSSVSPFWVWPVWGCPPRWSDPRWWGWAAPGSRTPPWFLRSSPHWSDSCPEPAPGPEESGTG